MAQRAFDTRTPAVDPPAAAKNPPRHAVVKQPGRVRPIHFVGRSSLQRGLTDEETVRWLYPWID